MLPSDQEGRLRCYKNALRNWNYRGYVNFKPVVQEWLAKELPEFSFRDVACELHRHVEAGGDIDEQQERRPEYVDYEFHYDLRVHLGAAKE